MMKRLTALCVALALAGCATKPIGPQSRAEWMALHTRTYSGISEEQVLNGAERVLKLADEDFTFDYPPSQLVAQRSWSIFMVLATAFGTDYWRIRTEPVDGGVQIMVEVSRQAGASGASPTMGLSGAGAGSIGVGMNTSTMPGRSIQGPFPYNLFWSRLDHALGKSAIWTTCKAAESGKTDREKINSDALCSVTTDDNVPEGATLAPVQAGNDECQVSGRQWQLNNANNVSGSLQGPC